MKVAFDVDGCLMSYYNEPRWDVVDMLRLLSINHEITVWSGVGEDHARECVDRLMIGKYVSSIRTKEVDDSVDLSFDDNDGAWAKINIKI